MKTKFPAADALKVADVILKTLSPFCERIAIAGSLRRLRPAAGDIELLLIPRFDERMDGLFDRVKIDLVDEKINQLVAENVLAKRLNKSGFHSSWGMLNKHAVHVDSGIPVDLFSTTFDNWAMSLVVRTGPKDFNIRLMSSLLRLGLQGHAYGTVTRNGERVELDSERAVFEIAGLTWLEPQDRF